MPTPHPRLVALFDRARQIWGEREDLRQQFGAAESLGYWVWLMSEGLDQYPDLRAFVPVPGPDLMRRVVGHNATDEFFQKSGLSEARFFYTMLVEGGYDPAQGGALLDFGCGCGRVLRFLARFADRCELHGCDPDADAVGWCRDNIEYASFEVLPAKPPSPFRDGRFDGVYAFSVFSHLAEDVHRQWLEDIHRITAPGGVVVLTTHGRHCAGELMRGADPAFAIPSPAQLRADLPKLEAGGYLYYPYDFAIDSMPTETRDEDLYGMTFFLEEYIRSNWLDLFDLVSFHEAPQVWQDYSVLRRK